jgi:hypothetical protein
MDIEKSCDSKKKLDINFGSNKRHSKEALDSRISC